MGNFPKKQIPEDQHMKYGHSKLAKAASVLRQFAFITAAFTATQFALAADPLNGQALYKSTAISTNKAQACSQCHGATPNTNNQLIWNASGTAANQGVASAITKGISGNAGGMGVFSIATATELADIAAYINAVRYGKAIVAPSTDCVAQAASWTVGGNTCNSALVVTTSGSTAALTDVTAPTTGSASFTCTNGVWGAATNATCTSPSACATGALSWTVGANTCNATAPATASGATAALSDTTAPTTGAASFACTNGVWGAATNVSCTAPVACAASALSWTVGGNTCDAAAASTASGASAVLSDTAAPTTGAATFACNNGVWGAATGATCTAPVGCTASALSWTVGGNTCNATSAATASGASAVLSDTAAPTTGAATFACTNGAWGAATNASCNAPLPCSAAAQSWTVGGNTCNASVAAAADGASAIASDITDTTGAATYACSNGNWTGPTAATCAAPAPVACASQAMSWTVGNNTCNATAGATASGASFSLTDSIAPTTGTAAVTCTNGVWAQPTAGTCNAATGPRGISSLNGESLWTTISPASCAGCHGGAKPLADISKIWNASGTSADKGNPAAIRNGINANSGGMGMYSAASDADLADIAAYVNATRYGKLLTDGSGAVVALPFTILQNGVSVGSSVVLPTIKFGAATTIKTTIAIQAPATGPLLISQMTIDNTLFTINRVPVAAIDRQNMATSPPTSTTVAATTPTAVVVAAGTFDACPATAFELQAGAACGLEVTMAVNNPGVISAKLLITTDAATTPAVVNLGATVDAVATGGAGGGGCTMRSAPGLFDPMLVLLSFLSLAVLGLRRSQKNKL
jgi:cytochrome c553